MPGVTLVEIRLPRRLVLLTGSAFNAARLSERTEPFRHWLREDPTKFGVSVLGWLQGLMLSGDEWITASAPSTICCGRSWTARSTTATCSCRPARYRSTSSGLPEIGFPIGFTRAGCRRRAILGGRPYEEDRLLEVAAAYQAVTDWHPRRPADPVLEPVKRSSARC